jgi:hypothetical protein
MEHSRIASPDTEGADEDELPLRYLQEIAAIKARISREWSPYRVMSEQPLMSDGMKALHQRALKER